MLGAITNPACRRCVPGATHPGLGRWQYYREIARSLKTSLPTIARWKMRFERDGLAGLEDRHLGSKPRAATPKVQARVIRRGDNA